MMNFLHPLSPRFRGFLYAFIILFSLVGVCYFLCLCLGSMDFFQALLSKVGFSLGNRALCSLFIKIGCPMSLAFAIGFLVKTFLAGSWIGRWVCPFQEGPSSAPNEGSAFTKVKTFFISCLGGHPPTKDILPEQAPRNWVEEADLPQAHPDDTVNDLREKIAIILESFFKNNPREHETFLDIAQRLALESKQSCGDGVSRQDFVRLLGALQDPSNPVYLKALECLEKHPR
uniref:Uncharacterized protein n=1 Tax=Rhizophora mucronata TaxID=61149 RepID=A0A2P2MW32_RHIMU